MSRGAPFLVLAALLASAALLPGACASVPPPPPEAPRAPPERAPLPPPAPGPAATAPSPGVDWGPPPVVDPAVPAPPAPLPRDPARISVLLSAGGPRSKAVVTVDGPCAIEGAPAGPSPARFRGELVARGDALVLDGAVLRGALRVRPGGEAGFRLDDRTYDGDLLASAAGGRLVLRNDLPFDRYMEGVLAGEMPASFPPEALRAQAVLARSFALLAREGLTDDPQVSQAYPGRPPAAALPALRAAVSSTAGMRLLDAAGLPLPNYWYHSTCGGHTAPASTVFGIPLHASYGGVPCPWCAGTKYARWDLEVDEGTVRAAVRFGSPVVALVPDVRDTDGRTVTLRATASGGTVRSVKAVDLRFALGTGKLRSTFLDSVEALPAGSKRPTSYRFRGRGWGHGVGLCQMGAAEAARRGMDAEAILRHYYPGTILDREGR